MHRAGAPHDVIEYLVPADGGEDEGLSGSLGTSLRAVLPEVVKRPLRTVRAEARRQGATVRRQDVAGGHVLRGTGMSGAENIRAELENLGVPLSACLVVIAPGETDPQRAIELTRAVLRGGGRVVAFGQVHQQIRGNRAATSTAPEAVWDRFELRTVMRSHWSACAEPVVALLGQWRFDLAWALDETVGTAWTVDAPGVHPRLVRVTCREADYDVIAGAGACARVARQVRRELVLPPTVAGMGLVWVAPLAFRGAPVQEVVCCAPMRSIGREAFAACAKLERVLFSDGLDFVGDGAFRDCAELRSVRLPRSLRSVGAAAFSGCRNLSDVEVPASVRAIGPDAFANCADDLCLTVAEGSYGHAWAQRHRVRHVVRPPSTSEHVGADDLLTAHDGVEYQELPGGMLELRRVLDTPRDGRLSVPAQIASHPVVGVGYQAIAPDQRITTLALPKDLGWLAPAAVPPGAATKVVTGGRRLQARGRHAIDTTILPPTRSEGIDADSIRLSLRKICALLQTDIPGELEWGWADVPFSRLSASVGTAIPGSIHFGVVRPGDTDLVNNFLRRGVRAFVSRRQVRDSSGRALPTVVHPRPVAAFAHVCGWMGQQYPGARKIAVAGSTGTGSMKEVLRRVCESDRPTVFTRGAARGVAQIGREIQRMSNTTGAFLQEVSTRPPLVREYAARMLRADALVVASADHEDRNAQDEEVDLAAVGIHGRYMSPDGVAFVDIDGENLKDLTLARPVITYAVRSREADYYAADVQQGAGSLTLTIVEAASGDRSRVTVRGFGRESVRNAVVSFAVGRWLGISKDKITAGIGAYRGEGLRHRIVEVGGQRLLVERAGVSEPSTPRAADALESMPLTVGGRRVLVLADGDEGANAVGEDEYRRVGQQLARRAGIGHVVCFGGQAAWAGEELSRRGSSVFRTDDREQLHDHLRQFISPENVVAFTGGQQMALPVTIDALFGTSLVLLDPTLTKRGKQTIEGGIRFRTLDLLGAEVRGLVGETAGREVAIPGHTAEAAVHLLGRNSFADTGIVSAVLPQPIRTIGPLAFARCVSLGSVALPSSLRVIAERAFTGCESLREVVVPEGVTTIERGAFSRCQNLERIRLPDSVRTIGAEAFSYSRVVRIECPSGSYAEHFVRTHWPTRRITTI